MRTFILDDKEFECVQFFCSDRNVGGVDVTVDGLYLGELIEADIPDPDDIEAQEKFIILLEDLYYN